jgi:hypothetical protein
MEGEPVKVTIIEGSPEELAEYEAQTGVIGQSHTLASAPEDEDPLPAGDGLTIGQADFENEMMLRSFIFSRARTPVIGGHVETYIRRALDLGGTEIEIGTSQSSRDGHADYLLVYNAGPRRYGAVAYVNAKNAGLTLRLTKEDVADTASPGIKFRDVQSGNGYQINCPVTSPDAIDLAIKLTQQALDKIRGRGKN